MLKPVLLMIVKLRMMLLLVPPIIRQMFRCPRFPLKQLQKFVQRMRLSLETHGKGNECTGQITAVMKHFKAHITKGKLATLTECQRCKTAEHPVVTRNRGISLKRKTQNK